MIIKACRYRTGHNRTDPDSELPKIQHDGLAKAGQPELAGIICGTTCKEISPRQTRNGYEKSLRGLQCIQRGFDTVKGSRKVSGNGFVPQLDTQFTNRSKVPHARIGYK